MKKKLEAELISIAHRILKIKDKSDIETLHREAQRLYEKLSVLRFVEENFEGVKPTIGRADIEAKFETGFDYDTLSVSDNREVDVPQAGGKTEETILLPEAAIDNSQENSFNQIETEETDDVESSEDTGKPASEKSDNLISEDEESSEKSEIEIEVGEKPEEVAGEEVKDDEKPIEDKKEVFIPSFELSFEAKEEAEQTAITPPTPQFTFDDLLGKDYADPVFIKPEEISKQPIEQKQEVAPKESEPDKVASSIAKIDKERRPASVNDRLSKGITIGLNDRIAFMKHLFGNSSEDYNRVLSQLITFDSFDEAQAFIDDMVKPDYDNWEGKDEYSQRFMEIIERRFS